MRALSDATDRALSMPDAADSDSYELVILNSIGAHVLVQQHSRGYTLPLLSIPRFTRPAEQITSLLRTSWEMKTVLLWSGRSDGGQSNELFAVLETIEDPSRVVPGLKWVVTDQAETYLAASQARLVHNSHAKAARACSGTDREPLSRLGWLRRLENWIEEIIRPRGTQLRDFLQLNGSESFSLVRFETDSNPLWFKAVGDPNLREFPITLLLARLFPNYLPRILTSDPLLNGWLMESGGELTLADCGQIEAWMKAITRLAEMQVQSVGHAPELLRAGCHDLRFETLSSLVTPFFEAMVDLMAQQAKASPPPLTIQEISDLARNVQDALSNISDYYNFDALGHADFNPGNILVGEQTAFTDWAEAYIGSPFPTFEYFLAHLKKSFPSLAGQETRLRAAYIHPWLSLLSEKTILRALNLSPLISPYMYAISTNAWRDPERLSDMGIQGSLRSLARRMKREADAALQQREPYSAMVYDGSD